MISLTCASTTTATASSEAAATIHLYFIQYFYFSLTVDRTNALKKGRKKAKPQYSNSKKAAAAEAEV